MMCPMYKRNQLNYLNYLLKPQVNKILFYPKSTKFYFDDIKQNFL